MVLGMETNATEPEKQCYRCGEVKSLANFYRLERMADGHFNKCKTCYCADVRANRKAKVGYYREYDRKRYSTDPKAKARLAAVVSRYGSEHPKAFRSHALVGKALRDGKLVRGPCEVCNSARVHGHHDDYDKPLEVRWLCAEHHKAWHDENGPGKNRD
jgi:hypothetical protein